MSAEQARAAAFHEHQPKAWLCRTAINAAIDFNRQARFVSWSESAEKPHNWEANDALDNGLMVEKIRQLWICPSVAEKSSSSATSKAVPSSRSPSSKLLCGSSACRRVPSRKNSRVAHLRLSIRNDIKPLTDDYD